MSNPNEIFDLSLAQLRKTVDPFGITTSILQAQKAWLEHPVELASQLNKLGAELWSLQMYSCNSLLGMECGDVFAAVEHDERFQEPVWTENRLLDVVKQLYLLYTRWLEDAIFETPGMEEKDRRRAAFWVRQGLNALAPNNYFWTNPHAVQRFFETAGKTVLDGARHWAEDSPRGSVSMVDESAFEVGKNLATTEGQVVMRNELLELIQYSPTTAQVHAVPLLIVAPWINKYYILDLKPSKSLVKYLVDQGYTVFITSWKNPTPEMRETSMGDYMLRGLVPAVEAVRSICEVPQIHATGYCIGGTMLAALMAWYARSTEQHGQPSPIAHWTLFTSLVDFANPGDIDVFIDEEGVAAIERMMETRGYLDGNDLAMSFRMLRSNSLIWNYFVHNYMYGEEPPQFEVLYWNTDSTRLPQAMHSFYLREFYLENKLVQPDAIRLGDQPIDLGRITVPLYAIGTEQDHIAPWKETFKICRHVSGECRYVLATSGHIMGIISPPVDPPKRRYWVGDATGAQDPEEWRAAQPKLPGSWWEDWNGWLDQRCGALQPPPGLGNETYPALAPAPGTYVLER